MWIPKHLKGYTQHATHQHKNIHVILDWFSYVIFTNNFWQELDLAYLVPLLLALLWFLKHVVLLQVGRAALYATPPFTCPVTSSLLRTQATLSHVRWIHPPSPSWLPPVLCQCWRSHGTPACLDDVYISKALWCGLWRHSFCACLIRSSTALHARWLFTRLVLMCAWHGWTAGGGHAGPASLYHSTRHWIPAMTTRFFGTDEVYSDVHTSSCLVNNTSSVGNGTTSTVVVVLWAM